MKNSTKGIGDRYQEETKYSRDGRGICATGVCERAEPYKQYPDAQNVIPLGRQPQIPPADLWDTLALRRSNREFADSSIAIDQLSLLVFATQGITGKLSGYLFRAAPSAGALYPIETYILANRVTGLDCGIYHHNIAQQSLELIRPGDYSRACASAALGQAMVSASAVTFIWTTIPGRSTWKYHERAYRYMYLDAGHIGQNFCLAATALGLGCCTIGAFFDSEVNEMIGIDGEHETAIYLGAVGRIQS